MSKNTETSNMLFSANTPWQPYYVALDKKILRFYAYIYEEVKHSQMENYRVRPVVIYYYLEDDTMYIIEPEVENSGLCQGKLTKRQRLPKNEWGDYYHWNDLNVAVNIVVYGVKYRITHCDPFTQKFMESKGIALNDPEPTPRDPYITHRLQPERCFVTPNDFDRLKQFLTLDRKVLRFFGMWHCSDVPTEARPVTVQYYLADDTVEILEVHEENCGRDPFPVLLKRQKLPKEVRQSFPSCVLEVTKREVVEYFTPIDFKVGEKVQILGRTFTLYNCDDFTKSFYEKNYPDIDLKTKDMPQKKWDEKTREIPRYNGFGSLEDTYENCLNPLFPKRPKKDYVKMMDMDKKELRYVARLDSKNINDEGRFFILSYFLANDTINIFERPIRGIVGGMFLSKTRIPKPGSSVEDPVFYGPNDFAIGSIVDVFGNRFILEDADLFVLKYMESIADTVPIETLDSLRRKLGDVNPETDKGRVTAGVNVAGGELPQYLSSM